MMQKWVPVIAIEVLPVLSVEQTMEAIKQVAAAVQAH
jgi:hypothetical protein